MEQRQEVNVKRSSVGVMDYLLLTKGKFASKIRINGIYEYKAKCETFLQVLDIRIPDH